MFGLCWAMWRLCWAYVWPVLGHFGASWGYVEACWACVGWFGALMGSKINTNQASVRLGFVLGLCCLCWGSCWAKMACSFGWSCYSPNEHASLGHVEAMWGPCWQPSSFFGNPNAKKNFQYNMIYYQKYRFHLYVPLWFFENYIYGGLICSRGRP